MTLYMSICLFPDLSYGNKIEQQSHESILSGIRHYLESHDELQNYQKVDIQLGKIDPRLTLSQCPQPLQFSLAPGNKLQGKTTIHAHCPSTKPWNLYITAVIDIYSEVYQTAENLTKGHIITARDLQPVSHNLAQLNRGFYTDPNQLIGKETRRPLSIGKIIHPGHVKAALLVKRGQQVDLVARNNQFSVKMTGQALMNGALGERIRVKNLSSKRIIEGKVTRNGEVTVLN